MSPSSKKHLLAVVGARPNFVKMSALVDRLREISRFHVTLLHTRQHYDEQLSDVFFRQLELPIPDVTLEIPRGSHASQTADTMREFDRALDDLPPVDTVVVVGDVNSTLATSLVAVKRSIPVAHIEAGLRSFNWSMPEEINRVVTDRISDFLFTPSKDADENLAREGIDPSKIFLVGNIMIDTLLKHREKARSFESSEKLGLERGGYGVVTLHRQENVDDPEILRELVHTVIDAGLRLPIVFPIHPRTRSRIEATDLLAEIKASSKVILCDPMGYLEFLDLTSGARIVLTDSGGLQEETTVLGVPCLTLRGETERPVTVTEGTNRVVGVRGSEILSALDEVLAAPGKAATSPALWDGKAALRVAEVLDRVLT